jgi:hypothetical protein
MRLGFAIVLMVAAGPALAGPRVAVHPLIVDDPDTRVVEQSKIDFIAEAANQNIQMVSRAQVAEVLATQPNASCHGKIETCAPILCRDTGASYALVATLVLSGPNFVLSAKLVSANGTFDKTIDGLAIKKDLFSPRAPQVQAAFKQLFAQLDLGSLPEVAPPTKTATTDTPNQNTGTGTAAATTATTGTTTATTTTTGSTSNARVEIPEVTQPKQGGTSPVRVAGFVVGGAGVVVAGVATAVTVSLQPNRKVVQDHTDGDGNIDRLYLKNARGLDGDIALATGLYVGAGVALAASALMILLSSDQAPPVAIAPVAGGAVVGVGGTF